jgi:hypothetical protein
MEDRQLPPIRRNGHADIEPYCVTASRLLGRKVTPADEAGRQIGKTADLALGFGGGVGPGASRTRRMPAVTRKLRPMSISGGERIRRSRRSGRIWTGRSSAP